MLFLWGRARHNKTAWETIKHHCFQIVADGSKITPPPLSQKRGFPPRKPILSWLYKLFTSDSASWESSFINTSASIEPNPESRTFPLQSGRSPGGGHGNPVQYPCLENPMDRGAWLATVHGLTVPGGADAVAERLNWTEHDTKIHKLNVTKTEIAPTNEGNK